MWAKAMCVLFTRVNVGSPCALLCGNVVFKSETSERVFTVKVSASIIGCSHVVKQCAMFRLCMPSFLSLIFPISSHLFLPAQQGKAQISVQLKPPLKSANQLQAPPPPSSVSLRMTGLHSFGLAWLVCTASISALLSNFSKSLKNKPLPVEFCSFEVTYRCESMG